MDSNLKALVSVNYDLPLLNIYFAFAENLKWLIVFLVVAQILLPKGLSHTVLPALIVTVFINLFYWVWKYSGTQRIPCSRCGLSSIVCQQYNLPLVIMIDHSSQ